MTTTTTSHLRTVSGRFVTRNAAIRTAGMPANSIDMMEGAL
jgi:hypothetical protein